MVHGRVQYTLTLSLTRHTAQATALGTPSPNAAGTYGFIYGHSIARVGCVGCCTLRTLVPSLRVGYTRV